MKYIYGAMLLHNAGQAINEENLKRVLSAANVEVDPAQVKAVVASLEGVDIDEVLKNAAVAPVAQPAQTVEATPKTEKKEEPKEEEKKSEEDAAAGLAALFG